MSIQPNFFKLFISFSIIIILTACSTALTQNDETLSVRNRLSQLQADSALASRAPVEVKEAELAVRAAEESQKDKATINHLVLMADRKVAIAEARGQSRLLVDQRKVLIEQRETARLESRTEEADRAHRNTAIARQDAEQARMGTESAQKHSEELQQQLTDLKARATERGLVITLGDLLFATGKAEIKGSTVSNLDKLAAFLTKFPKRTAVIEGHTDNVGSEYINITLSQRRADAVKQYLVNKGVDTGRLLTSGKGESVPVADNDSFSGRQQNRRVEIIVSQLGDSLTLE